MVIWHAKVHIIRIYVIYFYIYAYVFILCRDLNKGYSISSSILFRFKIWDFPQYTYIIKLQRKEIK